MASKTVNQQAQTGDIQAPVKAAKFHSFMLQRARDEKESSGSDAMDSQLAAMIDAVEGSQQDVWDSDARGTIQGRDIPGIELTVHSMNVHESNRADIENGHGYFITAPCTCLGGPSALMAAYGLAPGSDFVLSTGAPLVVGKIRVFEARGELPVSGVLVGIKGGAGTVLKLAPLPVRAQTGSATS
jgi:hypothetical protein